MFFLSNKDFKIVKMANKYDLLTTLYQASIVISRYQKFALHFKESP